MAHGFQFLRWPVVVYLMSPSPDGDTDLRTSWRAWNKAWRRWSRVVSSMAGFRHEKSWSRYKSLILISVNDQFLAIDLGKSLINDIDFYGPWLPAMFDWGYFIGISMGFRTSTSLKWCLAPCLNMGAIGPYCHLNLRTRWWWYGWNTGGGNHQNDGKWEWKRAMIPEAMIYT